jgi:hypothetical protein
LKNTNSGTDRTVINGVCCIGVNHDDRYAILKRVVPALETLKLPCYIKLYVPMGKVPSILSYMELFVYFISGNKEKIELWKLYYGKYIPSFVITKPIPTKDYNDILNSYSCILDTERPEQQGETLRAVWTIAAGKKLITTNKYIVNEEFYDPKQIFIIDRKKPIIPVEFIQRDFKMNDNEKINKLRIDNWVKTILE